MAFVISSLYLVYLFWQSFVGCKSLGVEWTGQVKNPNTLRWAWVLSLNDYIEWFLRPGYAFRLAVTILVADWHDLGR